jgi:hypothetical protein
MEAFNEKKFIEILRGQFDKLPKDRSKIVRIFLSSTFSGISIFIINYQNFFKICFLLDTHSERDHLIEFVYPDLKKYCKQNYGLDFQVRY